MGGKPWRAYAYVLRGFSHGGNTMLQKSATVQVTLKTTRFTFFSRLLNAIRNPLFYVSSFKGSSLPWGTYFRCGGFNPCEYHFVRISLFEFSVRHNDLDTTLLYSIPENEID